ncbi:MAG: fibronectin type III domain-containing protein [Acidobacteria bacterium]|nr:fibronectin type III domain-containing protein [Acidobacteriota bacterium]
MSRMPVRRTVVTSMVTVVGMILLLGAAVSLASAQSSPVSGPRSGSGSRLVSVASVPSAPTGVAATWLGGSIRVSWNAPVSDGGEFLLGYTASVSGGGSCSPTRNFATNLLPTTCDISGSSSPIPSFTTLTVSVQAQNFSGLSAAGTTSITTGPYSPGAPTGVTATAGDRSFIVSWTAPTSNGGTAISSYTATATGSAGTATCTATAPATTCTISGLTNGSGYLVYVTAFNGVTGRETCAGDSCNYLYPGLPPGPPQSVSLTPGPGTLAVSWLPPSSAGGTAISGYTATARMTIAGQETVVGSCTAGAGTGTISCTISGLTNGFTYSVTVKATNSVGSSVASTAVTGSPRSVPGAPGTPVFGQADTQGNVFVSWWAPGSNGGSAITGYTVTLSPGGRTCTTTGAVSCLFSSLQPGTSYTATVTATNLVGTGAASAASTAFSFALAPAAPAAPTVTVGDARITVTWTAPSANGAAITGYTAVARNTANAVPSYDGPRCTATTATSCTIGGLVNGATYVVAVNATNSAGTSAWSAWSGTASPFGAPTAPTQVTATAGDTIITVAWAASSSNGSDITGYTVSASPGTATCTTTTELTCTLTGLTIGTTYTVTVRGINAAGTGAPSTGVTATPFRSPGAPGNVTAASADRSLVVTWLAATGNGGAITAYTATATPGGASCTTTGALTCTIGGLTNGTKYTIVVVGSNAAGPGPASSPSAAVAPAGVPAAPTAPTVTAGLRQLVVRWTAPSSNGSPITGYVATASPGGATCSSGGLTCKISGLTAGTPYTVTVVATNAAGSSVASPEASAVAPFGLPGAPVVIAVQPGNATLTVTMQAPSTDGGSPIISYTAVVNLSTTSCTAVAPELTCTISGLTNGTTYFVTATAANAGGSSRSSAAVGPIAPIAPPNAPTGVVAAAQPDGRVVLTWNVPNSSGQQITGYTATASPGGATCTSTVATCTFADLTGGVTYTFTVTATSFVGTGPVSAPSNAVTPNRPPDMPASATAVAGVGSVTVSWAAPVPNGGTPITGYVASASPGGATCATTSATTCVITGLQAGTAVTISVVAVNAAGTGPAAVAGQVVPYTIPGAPGAPTVTAGSRSLNVSWSPSAATGWSRITSYTATASPGGATCSVTIPESGPEVGACTIANLTPGQGYTVTLTATNIAGTGPASPASAMVRPYTVPGAPSPGGITATSRPSALLVAWNAPASDGGSPVTGYRVTLTPGGGTCTTTAPITSCTIGGLTNGTAYQVSVAAMNIAGTGSASASVTGTPRPAPPLEPTAVTLAAGPGSIIASWTAGPDGDSPITGYTVTASPGGATCTTTGARVCTISGLTPGAAYTVTVKARNALGLGPASVASTMAIPYTVPGAPTAVSAVAGSSALVVRWDAPLSSGFTSITGYSVWVLRNGVIVGTCTTTDLSCTVTSLLPGVSGYSLRVAATNAAGSTSTEAPTAAIPYTTPGAPSSVSAVAFDRSLIVSWVAPTATGSTALTGFIATASPGGATCTVVAPALTCTIGGLTNGTRYTVTARATNIAGTGPASVASAAVAPRISAPLAPTGVSLSAGSSSVLVSWSAPDADGGSAIIRYVATASPGGATCTATAPATTCTIVGITPGTPVTVTVVAVNAIGTGPSSTASASVIPYTRPGAPTGVALADADGALVVTWTAPASNGSNAITSYTATALPGGRTCTATGAARTCTIDGLTPGTSYTVTVVATNAAGGSPASAAAARTAITKPGAVTGVSTSVIGPNGFSVNGSVVVSWTSGATAGTPVTGYTVTASASPGGGLSDTRTCTTTGATTCTLTSMKNGWTYSIVVVAANVLGAGPGSTPVTVEPALPPSAPQNLSASEVGVTGTQLLVQWSPPANAALLTPGFRYTATASPGGATCINTTTSSTGRLSCVLVGLTPGTRYSITVSLTLTSSGTVGPSSSAAFFELRPPAPGTPTVTSDTGKLIVSWTAPVVSGSPITSYTASAADGAGKVVGTCVTAATSCTITGLTTMAFYNVSVTATNTAGTSPSSPSLNSLAARAGFGVFVPTTVVARGGTYTATVAGAPVNRLVTVTFAGGATGTCTTGAQGWCIVTSSAVTSAGSAQVVARYTNGSSTVSTTNGPTVAAPFATCSLDGFFQLAYCTLSGTLPGGSVTFRLDEDSGATIASGNAPGLTPRTFDISDLSEPGGYLYLYNNGVLFFTYTIRVI